MEILTKSGAFNATVSFSPEEPGILFKPISGDIVDVIAETFADVRDAQMNLEEIDNIEIECEFDYHEAFAGGYVGPW